MKISIITPCLNSEDTIKLTLASVISQSYKNIEHILVDGGSTDKTLEFLKEYNNKKKKIFAFKNMDLYESINYGIKQSQGDYIAILNSDDIYNNNSTVEVFVKNIKKTRKDLYFGNTVYFNYKNISKIVRYYNNKKFKKEDLKNGIMPSHTASFVSSETYKKVGKYDTSYKIAGDFDFFFRAVINNNLKFEYIDNIVTRMRTGGISGKNIKSYFRTTNEIINSLKKNGYNSNFLKIFIRIPKKFKQFFFINQNKLNKEFKIPEYRKYNNLFYDFIILRKLNKLNTNKNFILSAFNLAYISSYLKKKITNNGHIINWTDGIFFRTLVKSLKKIPGREVMNKIKINNNIKKILIYGNLTPKGHAFLKKKFNRKIYHENLSYGSAEIIFRKIKRKILKKDELVFITLPTPKQEIIANKLSNINQNFKIICIGGSISIACGDEIKVPNFFSLYLEWLWRLRYEPRRRVKRLLQTLYNYIKYKIYTKKIENFTYKIIE